MTGSRTATAVALGAAATLGALALAAPAVAVQTATFGLQPVGAQTTILVSPGSGTAHRAVEVYNRTSRPLTIGLDVVGVDANADGTYELRGPGEGFASSVGLSTRSVTLAPRGHRTVTLAIDAPDRAGKPLYAAVTAVTAGSSPGSGLGVQERLAVLVGVLKGGARRGVLGTLTHDSSRLAASLIAAALLAAFAVAWRSASRRTVRGA